jgi:A/G-specific adenine glycosylase
VTPEQELRLLAWYGENARSLPWRRSRELYPVLVSELMLQQTTVAAVIPLYRRWMDRFPTVEALAAASLDSVMEAWSGLGYYSRAKRLHQTAQILSQSDTSPSTLQDLLNLPGIGPYTAAAVASIALGLPHLALDTNAFRVLLRLYGWPTRTDLPGVADRLRQRVEGSLPNSDFGITNQAIMELGATLCKVRAPACLVCPLMADCRGQALAIAEQIPVAKPKKPAKVTPTTAYLVRQENSGAIMLVQGTSLGLLSDLFAPPLDFHQENPSHSPMTSLLQWLRPRCGQPAAKLSYGISGRRLELEICQLKGPDSAHEAMSQAKALGVEARLWTPDQNLALSSLTRKVLGVWRETHADLQQPDETCSAFGPAPTVRPC